MGALESILCDFYDCLKIPIQILDENLKFITSKGYCDSFLDMFNELEVINEIKSDLSSTIKLNYLKNINFIVIPVLGKHKKNKYFIIGPFKSENTFDEINMPFKPYSCIDYISSMLEDMIKDRLYKKNNFSSYIKEAIDFIHRNYYNDINLETVCNHLKLNKSYFCQIFKKETGYTFSDFLNRIRVEKSKEYLTENNDSILDIALSVGYNNHTYYTSIFKKYNGVTPKEYRQKI